MRFEEALKAMREGKKVATKKRFRERYFVDALYIEKGCLMWRCIDDEDYPVDDCDYGLSGKEIMSEDWEIVDE